ncbi:hypothetical protein [Arthrobacter antioxidans]|uniref:hypothetical protein n=1 Tax=Arthrobacter antioxidans TaxID=2895818 RepID=UPI001FFEBC8D|nr:hypothetical protein [Arthrobacter antioxidans]
MTAYHRLAPGLAALMLSFLAAHLWHYSGPGYPSLFAAAHTASAVLCITIPGAFVLVGRLTRCRPDLRTLGAVLLAIAALPLLVANGIYLIYFGSVEASYGDIGAFGLMMLGFAALLVTSVACIIGLLVARPTITSSR